MKVQTLYGRQHFYGRYREKTVANLDLKQELVVVENAVATPRVRLPEKTYTGGLYWPDGRLVEEGQRATGGVVFKAVPEPFPDPLPEREEVEDVLYMGSAMTHFGHFLVEILPRLWALEQWDGDLIYFHRWIAPQLPKFMTDTLNEVRGRPVRTVFVDEPMRFRRAAVPTATFMHNKGGSELFNQWVQRFAAGLTKGDAPPDNRLIYYSRFGLDPRRRKILNEDRLEAHFERRGFLILKPETMDFFSQVQLAKTCRILAGCEGSALHQSMFMNPDAALMALDYKGNLTQQVIDHMADRQTWHLKCLSANEEGQYVYDEACAPYLDEAIDQALAATA